MFKTLFSTIAVAAALTATGPANAADPGGDYKKVSTLVEMPEFIPGMGTLYVQPDTLPAGPFLAYDADDKLVSTIYMVPLADMQAGKKFSGLAVAEILTRSDRDGGRVWSDPAGLWIEPGTSVRWVNQANVHTATAYHPANDNHALRIPENAEPWDSGYLVNPGDSFAVTLTEPGVYDYYCAPHEAAGLVGPIIVGELTGPGSRPFDWFKDEPDKSHWKPVPEAARGGFPAIGEIMARRVMPCPQEAGLAETSMFLDDRLVRFRWRLTGAGTPGA